MWISKRLIALIRATLVVLGFGLLALPAITLAYMSQSYTSTSSLPNGAIVSLLPAGSSGTIQSADAQQLEDLLGVVISSQAISGSSGSYNLNVATTGTVPTLVSNVNGSISKGDPIAVSPVASIGMKATTSTTVIGVAEAAFNAQSTGASSQELKGQSGQLRSYSFGIIPVEVKISSYQAQTSSFFPQSIQNLFNNLAGHNVSTARILLSLAVLVMVIITSGIIVFSAVQLSMVAMGRNPLAKRSITRGLSESVGVALGLLVLGCLSVYLIVRA